jgi:hypothetical protein
MTKTEWQEGQRKATRAYVMGLFYAAVIVATLATFAVALFSGAGLK